MGKRKDGRQSELWIAATEMPQAPGHPFYRRFNELLKRHGFDVFAEELRRKFHANGVGRNSILPGVYFRMLLIGYFEGIDLERGLDAAALQPANRGDCDSLDETLWWKALLSVAYTTAARLGDGVTLSVYARAINGKKANPWRTTLIAA